VTKSKYDVLDYRWRARWSRWWNITRPSAARQRNLDTSGGLILGPEIAEEKWIESGDGLFPPSDDHG
jgi:hypothetical protein